MRNSVNVLLAAAAVLAATLYPRPADAALTRIAGPTHLLTDAGLVDMFDVAFDSDRQVYLAVWGTFAFGPTKGQFLSPTGAALGTPFTISPGSQQAGWARVVYGGGKFLVSYTYILGSRSHRRAARFVTYQAGSPTSPTMSSEMVIDTWSGGAGTASGMAYSNGRYIVGWWTEEMSPPQTYVTILNASGAPLVTKVRVSTEGDGQTSPEIACDSARGRCLIVGQQWGVFNPGWAPGTWGQFITDDTATRIGSGFTVGYGPIQKETSVTYSAAGDRFIVAFSRHQHTVYRTTINAATRAIVDETMVRNAAQSPEGVGYGMPIISYNPTTQTSVVAMMPWIGRTAVLELDKDGWTTQGSFQFVPGVSDANFNSGTKVVAAAADPVNSRFLSADVQAFQHMRSAVFSASGSGGGPPPPPPPPDTTQAALTSPATGSTLSGSTQTFTWSAATGASYYALQIGRTQAGSEIFNMNVGTATSYTVGGLPTNGGTLWVRLMAFVNGQWATRDYQFTAATLAQAASLASPAAGSTLSSATQTFTWSGGSGVSYYALQIGTTQAGTSLFNMNVGTATSYTVSGLPTNGGPLWVRLMSHINGSWVARDYQFTAATLASAAQLTSPSAGSTLSGGTQTFTWSGGTGVAYYALQIGTTQAGTTIFNMNVGTATSYTVSGLPTGGGALWVRLMSHINGNWVTRDYQFTAANLAVPAQMLSPAAGTQLTLSTQTFTWTASSAATAYWLDIGSVQGGAEYVSAYYGNTTSATIRNLPATGGNLWVRVWSLINGTWRFSGDVRYTAPTPRPAQITSHHAGQTLTGSSVTLTWNSGAGATAYWLEVGSVRGGYEYYSNFQGAFTSRTVTGLPTNGGQLWVRLWSLIGGVWTPSNAVDLPLTASR